jgi:hypothetical protein|tara:strand:+ start:266 stop:1660 length:1395 start_codon:yes stop_codon:yes gene_type:complete
MKNLLFVLFFLPLLAIGQGWTQIGSDIDGEAIDDRSGHSVAINTDGTIVAIGALSNDQNGVNSGHVRIYQYILGVWTQLGQDIDGATASDGSGSSIALSDDGMILAIGSPYNSDNGVNAGHVRVFNYGSNSGQWTQIGQNLDGESAGDEFGRSVSLSGSGSFLAIGGPKNAGNGNASGHVRVFEYNGLWNQVGSDIDGEAADDLSGYSVSLKDWESVLYVAISAKENDGSFLDAGHVRIYTLDNSIWYQVGNDIDGEASGDDFGRDISLNSDASIIAIGASGNDDSGSNSGHARVYELILGSWSQIGQDLDGEADNDYFGKSVSLNSSGNVLAVGGYMNDANNQTTPNKGHVMVFNNVGGSWYQVGTDIDGEAANNYSGASICLNSSGSRIVIGAPFNADNGSASGQARIFENIIPTSFEDYYLPKDKIVGVFDILSRPALIKKNKLLFYIFDDGSVVKKIILD